MAPMILASCLAERGMNEAVSIITAGGSALDAVEGGIRTVEADEDVTHVALGGHPNMLGVVECDAAVMDGQSMQAGAVAALQGCLHPVTAARRVMEHLPHVLLSGEGARRFAAEAGVEQAEMLTA